MKFFYDSFPLKAKQKYLKVKEKENLWHSEEELAQQNLSPHFIQDIVRHSENEYKYKKNFEARGSEREKTILKHLSSHKSQFDWKDVKKFPFSFQLHQDASFIIFYISSAKNIFDRNHARIKIKSENITRH